MNKRELTDFRLAIRRRLKFRNFEFIIDRPFFRYYEYGKFWYNVSHSKVVKIYTANPNAHSGLPFTSLYP